MPDEVFSSKAMGDGVVIFPSGNVLYSPIEGEIRMIFPSKHAIGIVASDGIEILIHVGVDTVNLEGKPFRLHCKQGDIVKQGQKLMEIDITSIEKEGYSSAIAMVCTKETTFEMLCNGKVEKETPIIKIR